VGVAIFFLRAWQIFFFNQSIGTEETQYISVKFFVQHGRFMGVRVGVVCGRWSGRGIRVTVGVANFLGQSIGINENNTFELTRD